MFNSPDVSWREMEDHAGADWIWSVTNPKMVSLDPFFSFLGEWAYLGESWTKDVHD